VTATAVSWMAAAGCPPAGVSSAEYGYGPVTAVLEVTVAFTAVHGETVAGVNCGLVFSAAPLSPSPNVCQAGRL
jgi:hypothetical protein